MRISDWSSDVCSSDLIRSAASSVHNDPPSPGAPGPTCAAAAADASPLNRCRSEPGRSARQLRATIGRPHDFPVCGRDIRPCISVQRPSSDAAFEKGYALVESLSLSDIEATAVEYLPDYSFR